MNHFKKQQIQNIADFNPREQLAKGALAKSVPMAMLKEFQRQITGYEIKAFNGGAKFRNGDTLLAKITPCLENGKTAFVDILDDGEVAFGSTEFIVLRAKNETNPEFLYYFAISPDFRKRAIECMEGTSGRQRVNENALKNTGVAYSRTSNPTIHRRRPIRFGQKNRPEQTNQRAPGRDGENPVRLLVCAVRFPRRQRQALQILRRRHGV